MQSHDEIIAAANQAIELVISSAFTDAPVAQDVNVDINKDGTTDYDVAVAAPMRQPRRFIDPDSATTEPQALHVDENNWHTEWDMRATVGDAASGASRGMREGVRVV